MDNRSFMEKATDEKAEERKREIIDKDISPFLGELAHRITRAKVISYIDALPEGETITASGIADSCGIPVTDVEAILDALEAEGFFDAEEETASE